MPQILVPSYKDSDLQAIRELANRKIPLFPIQLGTKKPAHVGWRLTKPDTSLTGADFPHGYGVGLTSILLVVDVDPRKFRRLEDGTLDNPIHHLCVACGVKQFDTFTVKTGGQLPGIHIYFLIPAGTHIRRNVPGWEGIDFLGEGHLVLGPGSLHPETGNAYAVIRGSAANIMVCPDTVLDICQYEPHKRSPGFVSDDDSTILRFERFLETRAGAIEGQDGDPWTHLTAKYGRDFGLSEAKTLEMMLYLWNKKCVPPWSSEGMARKVASAYQYAKNTAGNRHAAADFELPQDTVVNPAAGLLLAQLDAQLDNLAQLDAQLDNSENIEVASNGKLTPPIELQREGDRITATDLAKVHWDLNKDNTKKSTIYNVVSQFRLGDYDTFTNPLRGLVRYNLFSHRVDFTRKPPWALPETKHATWDDGDTVACKRYFGSELASPWDPSKETILDGVVSYAKDYAYHPVRDYLRSLTWDGVPRISGLFSRYAGADDNVYTRAVSRCTLIAAVARVMDEGCKHDYIPVMESRQGLEKGKFIKELGDPWYADLHIDPKNKDTAMLMQGRWIVEIGEFVCAKKSDTESLKRYITLGVDRLRLPYDRSVSDVHRQSIFIATINPPDEGYLKDPTGNRRFWPVKVTCIDLDALKADKDQLWAEAFVAYQAKELWYMGKDVEALAEKEQHDRLESEPWSDIILTWLHNEYQATGIRITEITFRDLCAEILSLPVRARDSFSAKRIAMAMAQLGWNACKIYVHGSQVRGYRHPDHLSKVEIENLIDGL